MRILADENFPRPAIEALRSSGCDVYSVAQECPGIPDEAVAALCVRQNRVLFTFDKDFGELIFRSRVPAVGVVLFRITPESPEDAAAVTLALVTSQPDLHGWFCVVTRDKIRLRPIAGRRNPK